MVTKQQNRKVHLLFFLIIKFSAIEVRLIFSHTKFMIS